LQSNSNLNFQKGPNTNCIRLKFQISDSSHFHDTILDFRNNLDNDSTILIICDTNQIGYKLEKMLIRSKYLPFHKVTGYISFMICLKKTSDFKEIGFFNLKRKTAIAWEVRRFKIEKNEISGIICLPGIIPKFTPIKEYDSLENIFIPVD